MAKIAKIHSGGNLKLTGFGLKFRSEIIRAGFSACGGSRYNYIYMHTYVHICIHTKGHALKYFVYCVCNKCNYMGLFKVMVPQNCLLPPFREPFAPLSSPAKSGQGTVIMFACAHFVLKVYMRIALETSLLILTRKFVLQIARQRKHKLKRVWRVLQRQHCKTN